MTDVTNTINKHDEGSQSSVVAGVTGDKKADLHKNLDTTNVVDTMEFFMMSNEVAEKFKNEIRQANIASLKNVAMIDFSYRTNDREHFSEFLGLNLALEKILANPEKKILLTSLIDVHRFLYSEKIPEDKKDKLKLLLSKSNIKFLQVPYSLDKLAKVFEDKERKIENSIDTLKFYESRGWNPYLKKFFSTLDLQALHLGNSIVIDLRAEEEWDDMAGVKIAYETFQKHPDSKIILCSLIPVNVFQGVIKGTKTEEYINTLLKGKNVRIIQSSGGNTMTHEEVLKQFDGLYEQSSLENTAKDTFQTISDIESETAFQKIIESEISRFLHDAKYWISLGSGDKITYDEQLVYLFNLPNDKKNDKWIEFENKLVSLLQLQHPSFKLLPRANNLQRIIDMYTYSRANILPEGTRFEGVFVDWDGTLYDNKNLKFNEKVIDMIKEYEKKGKKITIRTGGNIQMKQKLLDEIGLPYTVKNKTDYKGGTVEIAIDNDSPEVMFANAKLKAEKHIKV